jgi:hypothetical protein
LRPAKRSADKGAQRRNPGAVADSASLHAALLNRRDFSGAADEANGSFFDQLSHDRARKESTMLHAYWWTEALLAVLESGINVVLRWTGGPHRIPQSNEDFVWY